MRRELKEARVSRGWSQRELGSRLGLPQMHISGIESGKIVPRYDTLLELVRILDRDLLMVPRALVPAVQSLIRDHLQSDQQDESELHGLNGDADDEQKTRERRDEVYRKYQRARRPPSGSRGRYINRLATARFGFGEQEYIDDPNRPTLSLSFKSGTGGLVTALRPVPRRVPPFFSNLLPERPLPNLA